MSRALLLLQRALSLHQRGGAAAAAAGHLEVSCERTKTAARGSKLGPTQGADSQNIGAQQNHTKMRLLTKSSFWTHCPQRHAVPGSLVDVQNPPLWRGTRSLFPSAWLRASIKTHFSWEKPQSVFSHAQEAKQLITQAQLERSQQDPRQGAVEAPGGRARRAKVPPPPALLSRTDTSVVLRPAPFVPASGEKVRLTPC